MTATFTTAATCPDSQCVWSWRWQDNTPDAADVALTHAETELAAHIDTHPVPEPRPIAKDLRSPVRQVTWRGETRTVTEWARELGMVRRTLQHRLDAGWDIERALTEAVW